jgi:hypothetical protein
MINCDKYKEMISLYIDNLLDEKEKSRFEEHMKNCSSCRKELHEIQLLVSLCSNLPVEDLPPNFGQKLHDKLLKAGEGNRKVKITSLFDSRYAKVFSTLAACIAVVFLVKGVLWWNDISSPDMTGNKPQSVADSIAEKDLSRNAKTEITAETADGNNSKSISPKIDSSNMYKTDAQDENALNESKSSKEPSEAQVSKSSDTSASLSKGKASSAAKASSRSLASDQIMAAAVQGQPQTDTEVAGEKFVIGHYMYKQRGAYSYWVSTPLFFFLCHLTESYFSKFFENSVWASFQCIQDEVNT